MGEWLWNSFMIRGAEVLGGALQGACKFRSIGVARGLKLSGIFV